MHEFRCYGNIAPNAKCQRVLVLALCLVTFCQEQFRFELTSDTLFRRINYFRVKPSHRGNFVTQNAMLTCT